MSIFAVLQYYIFFVMVYEYNVSVPATGRASFRALARQLGWKIKPRKLSPYEQSKMEARTGQVYTASSVEEMMSIINNN